jgi:uncharacterized protein GlcG (DUF336 family)
MLQRVVLLGSACALFAVSGLAQSDGCGNLPSQSQLKSMLTAATNEESSGLNMNMWGTIVDRDGIVCAVAFTGKNRGSQWPASRVISAQKANTANSLSLDPSAVSGGNGGALALSTANLYSAVQPGGSLFGLPESNPVDTRVAYKGPARNFGGDNDPMVGSAIGGVNVFGGGLALYDSNHAIVGGIGVSGDTSCADHNIAWRTRHKLDLDHLGTVIGGVSGDPMRPDNIIYDITLNPAGGTGKSAGGFGHPSCLKQTTDPQSLPAVQP